MPLTTGDRRFLQTIERFKAYLLLMAVSVFLYLLFVPAQEIRMTTSVIGVALCGVFWLTQRLLTFITLLDLELTRILHALKHSLPEAQRKELFPKG